MQHERAPRATTKGKNSYTASRNSVGGSRGKNKKSISDIRNEKEQQLSSEPNSPYSSSISTEQWNELESSADGVFLNFDSRLKKEENDLSLSRSCESLTGLSKFSNEVHSASMEKSNLEMLDKNNGNMQFLEQEARENCDNSQLSTSSTEGESSTNYDGNKNKNGIGNQNEVIGTNISNIAKDNGNTNEARWISTKANHSYNNFPATNADDFNEHGVHAQAVSEFCAPASFSLYDSSIQLLYTSVSWARSIPMFMELPFRDQAILLEEAWSELFLLNAVHFYLPVDTSTLFSTTGLTPNQSHAPKLVKEIRTLQNVVARFHQLQMDAVEYACLKAVVLFKSGTSV